MPGLGPLFKAARGLIKAPDLPPSHSSPWYPRAQEKVSGLKVRGDVPNMSSIAASMDDWDVLPGTREVSFAELSGPDALTPRTRKLRDDIEASGEINPLIVAHDELGPYILEGGHRFDALQHLGKQTFPAVVVKDRSDGRMLEQAKQLRRGVDARSPASPVLATKASRLTR